VSNQPLLHRPARGAVLNYRVHVITQGRSSKRLFPADNATSLNVSNLSRDKEYFLAIDARTQVGYNDSLHLRTICIPSSVDGLCVFLKYRLFVDL